MTLFSNRRLEEFQSQLAEEKDKVAHLNEQVQQEKSHKERELKEARETHHSQINELQEKISGLVVFDLVPCSAIRITGSRILCDQSLL